jgi:hypothetical protein
MTLRSSCLLVLAAACGGHARTVPLANHGGGAAGGPIAVAWRAALDPEPGAEQAKITIVVAGSPIEVGALSTAADGAEDGTLAACRIRADLAKPTVTAFECGGTPAYNYMVAELAGAELVVTRIEGVDPEPEAERRTVVARIPVTGTQLAVAPWTPAGAP